MWTRRISKNMDLDAWAHGIWAPSERQRCHHGNRDESDRGWQGIIGDCRCHCSFDEPPVTFAGTCPPRYVVPNAYDASCLRLKFVPLRDTARVLYCLLPVHFCVQSTHLPSMTMTKYNLQVGVENVEYIRSIFTKKVQDENTYCKNKES